MLKIIPKGNIEKELSKLAKSASLGTERIKAKAVREIISEVAKYGDKALFKYTKKFDKAELNSKSVKVTQKEISEAYDSIDKEVLAALQLTIRNVTAYHEKQRVDQWFETGPGDVVLGQRSIPIERVGIYVPGGEVSYPSTVIMNAIPAKIAGVREIVMVTPPMRGKKKVNPYVLVAAKEMNITEIYKVGGAQAIAALAYGTESILKVDKIVGPGNIYVTLAKKQVYGDVGIDKLAGPSDVLIVADSGANPEYIAADLLAQAEHDPDARAILVTVSQDIAKKVQKAVDKQLKKLSRKNVLRVSLERNCAIFVVEGMWRAMEIINTIAPEHLELMVSSPQKLLEGVKNAGAVFLGPYSPEVVGDYLAGPNHVLPTGGTARFSSPLGVYDFVKKQSIIGYTKPALKEVYKHIKILAEVEGLDAHARAAEIRFK